MKFFDVIWIYDRALKPQKWKMQICLHYDEGWFLRINTKDVIRPCVAISRAEHAFLDHDSHIDCGLCMIDEYEIDEAMKKSGIIGTITTKVAPEVLRCLLAARYISKKDKETLAELFGPHCA